MSLTSISSKKKEQQLKYNKIMKQLKKTLLTLVALFAMTTGAWAQTETLLTTITPTGKDTYSETTPGVVTVTHDNDDFYG